MSATRLQDDLLHEFREEKRTVESQIELIEPLSASLRKPAVQRVASKGLLLFGELLCWAMVLVAVAMCLFLSKLYPFYLLFELSRPEHVQLLGLQHVQMLRWAVYALIILAAILFAVLGRSLARIRQKNSILNMAGSRVKTILGQHLARKKAIEALEQKHFAQLPPTDPVQPGNVNDVPNPGYDPFAR